MQQRLSFVTLGVADVARARRFYCDGLGWRPSRASQPEVVFIDAGGVVLSLWGREALAADAGWDGQGLPADGGPSGAPSGAGFRGVALAHNVARPEEVDAVLALAESAGGRVLKPAQDAFWGGRSGYFADPDGHVWEIAWNPVFPLDEAGRPTLPPP